MKRSDLAEFEFEEEGFKIKIKRGFGGQPVITSSPSAAANFAHTIPQATPLATSPNSPTPAESDEAGFAFVKSPMVGTFYRSPSPENPSFVEVGAKVEDKSVVCIIEAMKIMNEIQAEVKGAIAEILVENGQPVEYGQRLFKIKLNS